MKKKIFSLSISQQLLVFFLPAALITCISLYLFVANIYKNDVIKFAVEACSDNLQLVDTDLNIYFEQYCHILDPYLGSNDIIKVLSKYKDDNAGENNAYRIELNAEVEKAFYSVKNLSSIVIVDNSENIFCIGDIKIYSQIMNLYNSLKDKLDESDGAINYSSIKLGNKYKIAMCKRIVCFDSNNEIQRLGYGFLLMNEQTLNDYYSKINVTANNLFYIYDDNNRIVSSNVRSEIGKKFLQNKVNEVRGRMTTIRNNDTYYIVSRALSSYEGYSIAHLISKRTVEKNVIYFNLSVVVLALLFIIVSVLFSRFTSKYITKPIQAVNAALQEVENGNFSVQFESPLKNEIGDLVSKFNHMTKELDFLVNKTMSLEIKSKEAQLLAYERQINPHFLYNTLDLIRSLVLLNEVQMVDKAIVSLSDLLRFNLKWEKEVTLKEEFDSLLNYFVIIKLRFRDSLSYTMNLDRSISKCRTLKFLLQPIVENAIFHGTGNVDKAGKIDILAKRINDEIIFIIRDNGIGMTPEKLEEVKRDMDNPESKKSLGLQNVNQRIKTKYGEKYGVGIESVYGEHTSVSIHIPAIENDESSENKE